MTAADAGMWDDTPRPDVETTEADREMAAETLADCARDETNPMTPQGASRCPPSTLTRPAVRPAGGACPDLGGVPGDTPEPPDVSASPAAQTSRGVRVRPGSPGDAPAHSLSASARPVTQTRADAAYALAEARAGRWARELSRTRPEAAWETFREADATCARIAARIAANRVYPTSVVAWGDAHVILSNLARHHMTQRTAPRPQENTP